MITDDTLLTVAVATLIATLITCLAMQSVAAGTLDSQEFTLEAIDGQPAWLLAPYLWAPSVDGSVGIGPLQTSFDLGARDLAGKTNAAAMGYLRATRGSGFFYLEGMGMRFSDPTAEPLFNQSVDAQVILTEIGYGRHYGVSVHKRQYLQVQPYVGVRYAELEAEIGNPRQSLDAEESWLDPVLGVITTVPLRPSLSVVIKVDGAGLGLGRDNYWNAAGLLQWQWGIGWSVAAGYRVARFDADPGGGNDLEMDLRTGGPMLGVVREF